MMLLMDPMGLKISKKMEKVFQKWLKVKKLLKKAKEAKKPLEEIQKFKDDLKTLECKANSLKTLEEQARIATERGVKASRHPTEKNIAKGNKKAVDGSFKNLGKVLNKRNNMLRKLLK